jgi:3-methyl-2-oxobutanoate hydroxymethyltransferase
MRDPLKTLREWARVRAAAERAGIDVAEALDGLVPTAQASDGVIRAATERLAREITAEVAIPTIGIGASVACDGQVLVVDGGTTITT